MGSVPPAVAQAAAVLTLAALLGAPSGAAGQEIPDSAIVTVIAQGLQTVWALAEAPDGRLFVTERSKSRRRSVVIANQRSESENPC